MKNNTLFRPPFLVLVCIVALFQFAHGQPTNSSHAIDPDPIAKSSSTNGGVTLGAITNRLMFRQKTDEPFPADWLLEQGFEQQEMDFGKIWVKEQTRLGEVKRLVEVELSDFQPTPYARAFEIWRYALFKNGYCLIQGTEGLGDSNFVRLTINTNLGSFAIQLRRFTRVYTNSAVHLEPSENRIMLEQKINEPFPLDRLLENGFKELEKNPGIWTKEQMRIGDVKSLVGFELSDLRPSPGGPSGMTIRYALFKNGFCLVECWDRDSGGLGDSDLVRVVINTNLPSLRPVVLPQSFTHPPEQSDSKAPKN